MKKNMPRILEYVFQVYNLNPGRKKSKHCSLTYPYKDIDSLSQQIFI